MRLATTASVAIIALSSAALAQVAAPRQPTTNTMENASAPANTTVPAPIDDAADNMLSNSASPPPNEPK